MQFVKFNLDKYRYVMPLSEVIEIIPCVNVRNNKNTNNYVAGYCEYRGCNIPVIDLGIIFGNKPCEKKLSTRIIIIADTQNNGLNSMIGLMVEKATEILSEEKNNFMDKATYGDGLPHNGPVLSDSTGLISLIVPDDVFSLI